MTRSQVRNIFSEARRIEFLWTRDQAAAVKRLSLLRPKMSYQAAKEGKSALLCAVLTEAINIVMVQPDKNAAFEKFMDFFEADLAYHRKAGGK